MYFTEPEGQREDNEVGMSGLSLIITIAGVIVLGILPSGILSIASSLFNSTH